MRDSTVQLEGPRLSVRFSRPHRLLSHAVLRPGFVEADAVAWLQVRDEELAVKEICSSFMPPLSEPGPPS